MTKLLYGTTNPLEFEHMQMCLSGLPIELISLSDLEIIVPTTFVDGLTPLQKARKRARIYFETTGMPVFCCDSSPLISEECVTDQTAICLILSEGVYFEQLGGDIRRFMEQAVMPLQLGLLTEAMAKEVCKWRYDGLYAVYNLSDWEVVVANSWSLSSADEREDYFQAIMIADKIIGFGRIQPTPEGVVLGIGLDPILCGKGYGRKAMSLLVSEAIRRYPDQKIILEVRRFNERAIKCYEALGFRRTARYKKETVNGFVDYDLMTLEF